MSVDQLIAKAMSTPQEPEAISCFLMARKRSTKTWTGSGTGSNKITTDPTMYNYQGHDAEYWFVKGQKAYRNNMSLEKQKTILIKEVIKAEGMADYYKEKRKKLIVEKRAQKERFQLYMFGAIVISAASILIAIGTVV